MFCRSVRDGSVTTELMTLLTCTIDGNSFDNIFRQIAFDDGMINIALEIVEPTMPHTQLKVVTRNADFTLGALWSDKPTTTNCVYNASEE